MITFTKAINVDPIECLLSDDVASSLLLRGLCRLVCPRLSNGHRRDLGLLLRGRSRLDCGLKGLGKWLRVSNRLLGRLILLLQVLLLRLLSLLIVEALKLR